MRRPQRNAITTLLLLLTGVTSAAGPNVILCMSDDQGWGDTGYNGHPILQTPHLDRMANEGLRFERFYAAAPVCSPTRGSCLTGRHPYRYGIFFANTGHMRPQEITLAELLRARGYATGHFGKWHLGTLTTTRKDANRGAPGATEHFAPPWKHGFEVCFSTESKVPTWDPMRLPRTLAAGQKKTGWPSLAPDTAWQPYGTRYWTGPEQPATENLTGDDSRVIMDRALPFIEDAVHRKRPFLAVIWFHAPHLPVVAGPEYAARYANQPLYERNYYGAITALDMQVGRLRTALKRLGVAGNTLLWFCADNGPEGNDRAPGRTGGLRGRKRSLYEGGIRVPGLLVWPDRIRAPRHVRIPAGTVDYLPTIREILNLPPADARPQDGVSLLPLIEGHMTTRPRPLAFESKQRVALIDNRYKLTGPADAPGELYDLTVDPGETTNLAATHPEVVASMRRTLGSWRQSCRASLAGADYP